MKKLLFLLLGLVAASNAFALVPADPTNVTWYDCGDESGHSYLSFTLPTVDVNGNALDIEMMGYRIYIDDDQIVSFSKSCCFKTSDISIVIVNQSVTFKFINKLISS